MSETIAADDAPYPRPALGVYVVGVLTLAWILAFLDRGIVTLLTPALKQDLLLSDTQISVVQGMAFSVIFALAGLPLGRLVDRANRRNIIIIGVLVWSLATLFCGLAENFMQLCAARLGVGIGEACLAPASFSLLADYLAPGRRGRAIGIVASGSAIGTAGSNILVGLILKATAGKTAVMLPLLGEMAVWRMVFIIFALPGIAMALLFMLVREPVRREVKDAPSAKADQKFLPYLLANYRVFFPLYAAFAVTTMVVYSFTIWGPIVFMRRYGMSPGDVGLMMGATLLVVGCFGSILGGVLSDLLLRRYPLDGRIRVTFLTYPGLIVCVALFAVHSPMVSLAAYAGAKVFGTMSGAVAYVILQDLSPNRMRGQVTAVHSLLGNVVGLSLGSTLIALVTDHIFRDEQMVAYSIVVVGLPLMLISSTLIFVALGPSRRVRRSQAESLASASKPIPVAS